MFNKKRKEVDPYENKIKSFNSQIKDARISLEGAVRAVLRKQDAIDVYPSGVDKDYPAPSDSHGLIEIFVYNYKRKGT